MRKPARVLLLLSGGVLLAVGGSLWWAYSASQSTPEFYTAALEIDPQRQEQASDEMLSQATTLASEVNRDGAWQAMFTAEQINGWLAVDLVKNHRQMLPQEASDPRVAITPQGAKLACRWQQDGFQSILSLNVDLYLAEPNVIALRVQSARAGDLPLPLGQVLAAITQGAQQAELPIRWLKADGDPVAHVTIPPLAASTKKAIIVEALELHEGAVYLSGTTKEPEAGMPEVANQAPFTLKQQR